MKLWTNSTSFTIYLSEKVPAPTAVVVRSFKGRPGNCSVVSLDTMVETYVLEQLMHMFEPEPV